MYIPQHCQLSTEQGTVRKKDANSIIVRNKWDSQQELTLKEIGIQFNVAWLKQR